MGKTVFNSSFHCRRCVQILQGHVSTVTSLEFFQGGDQLIRYIIIFIKILKYLLLLYYCIFCNGMYCTHHFELSLVCSGGRDQVVCVWDLSSGSLLKTLPVFEVQPINIFATSVPVILFDIDWVEELAPV